MKNKALLILLVLGVISLTINLLPIFQGIFPLTYDQGRDFLWVKNQLDWLRPSLVGPIGSLEGVFFGPLWFWLLTMPYLLSNGSPLAMTLFNSLIVYGAVLLAARLFWQQDKRISYFILLLGFISPAIQGLANHAFSQHLLPLLTVLFIYSLSRAKFVPACLWLGLMFHAEPAISVFSIPALLISTVIVQRRQPFLKAKTVFLGLGMLLLTFLPLILFDLRNNFIQLKAWADFLSGNNRGLQEIVPLSFGQRLINRPLILLTALEQTFLALP